MITPRSLTSRPHPSLRPEVSTPPKLPQSSPEAGIESLAQNLEDMWEQRVPEPTSVVGIIVEKDWKPETQWDPGLNIADAVMDAGGRPKLLYIQEESATEQMQGIDALAIPGGRDVHPSKYGQEMGPGMANSSPRPDFDDFEIEAIQYAFDQGMPMMGHCRGHQIMNVAGGGTLIQDLPTEHVTPEGWGSKYGTEVNHRPEISRHDYQVRTHEAHLIAVQPGSRLHHVAGDDLESVNSIHHQAVDQVSPLMEVVAHSLDGVVEASQRKGMPWQHSVQFHPESQRYTDPNYQMFYDQLVDDGAAFRRGELS